MSDHKMAKDLAAGDRIIRSQSGVQIIATVMSTEPSAQIVRRPVVIATLKLPNGRLTHANYSPNTSVILHSEGEP